MPNIISPFANTIVCEEPVPSVFLADGSMVDSTVPEDLSVVLKQCFGQRFEGCFREQKILLIEMVSFTLRSGGSFFEIADQWNGGASLPVEVIGAELNFQKGNQLLRELIESLGESSDEECLAKKTAKVTSCGLFCLIETLWDTKYYV
jgi:hypothetical protein